MSKHAPVSVLSCLTLLALPCFLAAQPREAAPSKPDSAQVKALIVEGQERWRRHVGHRGAFLL